MKYFAGFRDSFQFLVRHEGYSEARCRSWMRVLAWYALVIIGRAPRVWIEQWQAKFVLPCQYRSPAKVFFVFRRDYEPEVALVERMLAPGHVFIDVGANFGLYSLLASHYVGTSGKVIAFEPAPDSFRILEQNIRENHVDNILACEKGLSDKVEQLRFFLHTDPGRNSLGSLEKETEQVIDISVVTLDTMVASLNLSRLDLIKMDVEGAEERVIRGAACTLETHRPSLLFEANDLAAARLGLSVASLVEAIVSLGYKVFEVGKEFRLEEVTRPGYGNFLALHESRLAEVQDHLARPTPAR